MYGRVCLLKKRLLFLFYPIWAMMILLGRVLCHLEFNREAWWSLESNNLFFPFKTMIKKILREIFLPSSMKLFRYLWSVLLLPVLGNPHAKRLYDDLLNNYNLLIRPVSNNTEKLTVRLGLKLSQLIDVVRSNQTKIFH